MFYDLLTRRIKILCCIFECVCLSFHYGFTENAILATLLNVICMTKFLISSKMFMGRGRGCYLFAWSPKHMLFLRLWHCFPRYAWFDIFRYLPHRIFIQIIFEIIEKSNDSFAFLKWICTAFFKSFHIYYYVMLLPSFGKVDYSDAKKVLVSNMYKC